MYSYFWQTMEAGHGDLGDIICGGTPPPAAPHHMTAGDWQLPGLEQVSFPLPAERPVSCDLDDASSSFQDPLPHELAAGTAVFSGRPDPVGGLQVDQVDTAGGGSLTDRRIFFSGDIQEDHHMNSPWDIFSRALQISPSAVKPPQMITGDVPEPNGRSAGCSVDHAELQMPSTPYEKRRKSPAKKVVCIPAPAAASSRPGGEVVPSDLWAWRKYGQKPIKGSPYPRGYYRCSSSKGCSARKQVERSRTDPSMLVITYTSEHNHPWPTQRTNALAGSTRSSLPAAKLGASTGARRPSCGRRPAWSAAEEEHGGRAGTAIIVPPAVKKEEAADGGNTIEPVSGGEGDPDVVVGQNYETQVPPEDSFFAGLDELGGDPLGLVELCGDHKCGEGRREGVMPDPFGILDWAGSWLGEAGNYGDL